MKEKKFNLSECKRTDGAYQDIHVKEFIKRQIDRTQNRIEELKEFQGCAEAMLQKAELEENLKKFKEDAGKDLT